MLDLNSRYFKKIIEVWDGEDIENTTLSIRNLFRDKEGHFSIFELMEKLEIMTILHDDKEDSLCRFITFKDHHSRNYLVLSASRSIEEMRFDAACMLRKMLKETAKGKSVLSFNCSVQTKAFSREDKHFACALLMPRKKVLEFITQKDEFGKYIYLDENREISLKNINAVADKFGVPFNKCCSRLFNMFEDLRKEKKNSFYIQGCYNRGQYKKVVHSYSEEQRVADLNEVAPNHNHNRLRRTRHLIDSLHYRTYDKLSEVARRKILINLIQFDAVNEKVVDTPEEVRQIINQYISCGGKVSKEGVLVTGDKELQLSDEQLIVIGEYDLSEEVLKKSLIANMINHVPQLSRLKEMSYKDAINSITEKEMCYFIKALHRGLFKRLEEKYDEERGGMYRNYQVYLPMTGVTPPEWTQVSYEMENLAYRILCILKQNVNEGLSNSEYIERVNEEIYNMIRMQPFQDGNKRTSKLLSNILYQEKGIPYTLVSTNNYGAFVDGWRSENAEMYNKFMYSLILESYGYFYGVQSATEAARGKGKDHKNIIDNKRR